MITKTFKLTVATDTEEQMQKEEEYLSMIYGAEEVKEELCEDCISRQTAINALWKALYEYEDKTEKQFLESEELDVADWFQHRIFVQNMSDIDRQTILNLPSAQPERKKGKWVHRKDMDYLDKSKVTHNHFMCKDCGFIHDFIDGHTGQYLYCPSCGAKMEVEDANSN